MADNLEVFGTTYNNVTGLKAYNTSDVLLTFTNSPAGTIVEDSTTTSTSVTSGSWTNLQTISLAAGVWVIVGNTICSSTTASADSSKYFITRLSTSDGYARQTTSQVSSVYSAGSASDIVSLSEATSITLDVYSGSNINIARSYLKAVRIA